MRKELVFTLLIVPILAHAAPEGFLYKKGKDYYFLGIGRPKPGSENKTQRLSLSREAAILDGKAKIAFYIDGLKTQDGLSIGEAKQADEELRSKVHLLLDGVMIVKSEWDDQDNCTTILKINRKNILKALEAEE